MKIVIPYSKYIYIMSGVFVALAPTIFDRIFYQTNDDRIMELISNGVLYQEPSSELIYISKFIGIILTEAFSINLNVNWYFLFIVFTQTLAIFLYLQLALTVSQTFAAGVLFFIPIIVFYPLFFSIQYTQTALVGAAIATLVILFEKRRTYLILANILLFISVAWRPNSAIVGISLVVGIVGLYEFRKLISKRFTIILGVSASSFFCFILFFNSWPSSQDLEKRNFIEFNTARESIQGYKPNKLSEQQLRNYSKQIGWSKNDFDLSQRKSYAFDPELYNTEGYLYLNNNKRIQPISRHYFETLKNFVEILTYNYLLFIGMFGMALLSVALYVREIKPFKFLAFIIGVTSLLFVILLMGKLPERLVWPIGFVALTSFIFIRIKENNYKIKRVHFLLPILTIFIVFLSINFSQDLIKQENWWKTASQEKILGLERIINFQSDKPIIAFASFYNYIWKTSSPLNGPSDLPDIWNHIIPIGWISQSPDMNRHLEELGIGEDLFTSIAEGNAYLAVSNIEELQMVSEFLREHKDIEIEWPEAPFVFDDSGFAIWKVKQAS